MRALKGFLILLLFVNQHALAQSFSDSSAVLSSRIASIESVIPLRYDQQAHMHIRQYRNNKTNTGEIIGRAQHFLPQIEGILKEYGLPADLQYLPLAASAFDHKKVSNSGGSGYWQMGYRIAMRQNLHVSTFVDERRDWFKATHAAARELSALYDIFNDWPLAIAAFYSDKTDVQIAIKMSKGAFDYYAIRQHLQAEATDIMPAYVAARYLMQYYSKEKIAVEAYSIADTAVFHPTDWLSFSQLHIATGLSIEEIHRLNPIFKKKIVPHAARHYELRLPDTSVSKLVELGDSLYKIKPGDYMSDGTQPEQPTPSFSKPRVTPDPRESTPSSGSSSHTAIYYTVRSGEFLGLIADIHDVNISDVRRWNGIRGDRINAGQQLKIMVPSEKVSHYKAMNTKSAAQKRQIANGD